MSKVLIVGGGAAGMAAAIAAAGCGHQVHVYEKNEKLGKKLYITGKGRCNVTNACDVQGLLANVVTNARFLYSSFYGFSNKDIMELMERNGCPLKVERGNRVFPVSDKSSDVIAALAGQMRDLGVRVHLHSEVKELVVEAGVCKGLLLSKGKERVKGDRVIVATGGLSYGATGSTGDGYAFARALGHRVTELSPALVPFCVKEPEVKDLQGLSLRNVEAVIVSGRKEIYREFGELLFTHFGVSGPVVLSASSFAAGMIKDHPLVLSIDLKPALDMEQLDARIRRDFEECANKQFKNSLDKLLPSKLIPVIIARSGIDPGKKVNGITREERQRLAAGIKALTFTLTGLRGYKEAIITQGGIEVKELDPSTMESRLVKNLHFAGEVLDLDGVTGGFNLQIAWSTGWAAGSHIPWEEEG
ncbi:MAG: NAD(P)/FAD-dependent oxidoreductase [Hungatella sp.]|nr:NAD(P)/FAD-dependent oxidoreductase [Hungatella sp.]